jgi:hypothetical protein
MAETAGTNGSVVTQPAPAQGWPVLYRSAHIVNLARHGGGGMTPLTNFAFAKDAVAVPLAADEMFVAQAYFPIVFTGNDPAVPMAVLGISRNLFVDGEGKWRPGAYVPAYVRRYPFILGRTGAGDAPYLAIDETASCYVAAGGEPFFANGAPSELARKALDFCLAFETQLTIARTFAEALHAAGVLVTRRADLRLNDGNRVTLDGFRVIDEALYDALPNDTILLWRRNGWLGLLYAQLLSMRKWQELPLAAPSA